MDSGDEIPALNESWTLAGAKVGEWMAGFMTCLVVIELFHIRTARYSPVLAMVLLGTTILLATLRRLYPDEEKGMMNAAMVNCGFAPPGIPTPAQLQPLWSGGRVTSLPKTSYFEDLKLDAVIHNHIPVEDTEP